ALPICSAAASGTGLSRNLISLTASTFLDSSPAMAVPLLDLKAQYATIRDSVLNAMSKVVDEQAFILGEPVERLEREVAQLSHTRHAIGVANGTDALLISLRALDIGRGDEVITTPFTFFATAGAVHNVGATPVFVDIDPETYNIVPAAVTA